MKKKVLLSSILTIALCLSLIAGSTFALFTSSTKVDIAVTAGKVDVIADLTDLKCYSVVADAAGTEVDENGNLYKYEEQANGIFLNQGTAKFENAVLTLDRITPGDKVEFGVIGTNASDVTIQYRYKIECIDGYKLMSGLVLTVNGVKYTSVASYTSPWATLEAGKNIQDNANVTVAIELPVNAGNEYQEQTTAINVVVEAVQGNAVVENNTTPVIVNIPAVSSATHLAAALADPSIPAVNILDDLAGVTVISDDLANKTIYVNGNDVAFEFTGKLENVVVDGIVDEDGAVPAVKANGEGDITVQNSKIADLAKQPFGAIVVGANVDLTVDNCELNGIGKGYGVYSTSSGAVTVKNSTFNSFDSWAIQVNGVANGDVVIDGCTFNTPDGVLKVLSGVQGDFTFTNNTMIGCKGHDGNIAKLVVSGSGTGPVTCTGTKTVTGNTLDGVAWTQ